MAKKNPYIDYINNGGYGLFDIPKPSGLYKLPTELPSSGVTQNTITAFNFLLLFINGIKHNY